MLLRVLNEVFFLVHLCLVHDASYVAIHRCDAYIHHFADSFVCVVLC